MSKIFSAAIFAAFSFNASAAVITFDEIDTNAPAEVLDGYAGFDWTNMYALDGVNFSVQDSGFTRGVVSNNNVGYGSVDVELSLSSGTFDFDGVYLAAAWMDDMSIQAQGYAGNTLIYDTTVVVSDTATWFGFNYANVDSVVFNSFGGVDAGTPGAGPQMVFDNITVTTVPIPAAAWLFGSALLGLGWMRRKV